MVIMNGQKKNVREEKSGETLHRLLLLSMMNIKPSRAEPERAVMISKWMTQYNPKHLPHFIKPALPSAVPSSTADCFASLKSSRASSTTAVVMAAWR